MEPLHLKHRPKRLVDLAGQGHLTDTLGKDLENKIQRSFIFHGPSGVGKTTAARIAADALGCPDPLEVDGASHTGVEDVRRLTSSSHYLTMDGAARVFILDECHRLSKQAWEAMLKSIEEPPAGVYWIFCTTEFHKVPATIKTRCHAYAFHQVHFPALSMMVRSIVKREGMQIPDGVANQAALSANGSARQALVNLAMVQGVSDPEKARKLLDGASAPPGAIDVARRLFDQARPLRACRTIFQDLKDDDPEGVRIVVFAYAQSVFLGGDATSEPDQYALAVMDAFKDPCEPTNRIGDIILRVAKCDWLKNRG